MGWFLKMPRSLSLTGDQDWGEVADTSFSTRQKRHGPDNKQVCQTLWPLQTALGDMRRLAALNESWGDNMWLDGLKVLLTDWLDRDSFADMAGWRDAGKLPTWTAIELSKGNGGEIRDYPTCVSACVCVNVSHHIIQFLSSSRSLND